MSNPRDESSAGSGGSSTSGVSGGGSIVGSESLYLTGGNVNEDVDVDAAVCMTKLPVVVAVDDYTNINNRDNCIWR